MAELDKDVLMEVDGIGESYAESVLDVYETEDELLDDGVDTVEDKTGIRTGAVESLFQSISEEEEEEAETDEESDKSIEYIERGFAYNIIHYEDGTTERNDDGGIMRR